jgi:hypothetical protein
MFQFCSCDVPSALCTPSFRNSYIVYGTQNLLPRSFEFVTRPYPSRCILILSSHLHLGAPSSLFRSCLRNKIFLCISLRMLQAPSTLSPFIMCAHKEAPQFLVSSETRLPCGRCGQEILFFTAPWSLWDQKSSYPVSSGFWILQPW